MKCAIIISAIVLFFCSCADNSKRELTVFKITESALEQSSKTINDITIGVHSQLFQKLNDPKTAQKAEVFQPKAAKISELSSSAIEYINKVRLQLIEQAGYNAGDKISVFESKNNKAVQQLFIQENKGKELYQLLRNFIDSLYSVDEEINIYCNDLIKNSYDYLGPSHDGTEFSQTFFNQISVGGALSVLAKFENDIRNTENKLVTYYNDKAFTTTCGYYSFQTLIKQSSNCVKAGDGIEITAGVGSFSVAAKPKFTIDGKVIEVDENGIVIYKFSAPSIAGKYIKPVKMEYFEPDGEKQIFTKNIEYTVIAPDQNPK